MSLTNELSKLINPPKNEIKGTIGMSRTVINVAGRGGFVWVRLLDNPNEVVKAHNPTVSPTFGMPVVMEWDGYKYEITGKDVERYAVWGSDSPLVGKHGQQHSAMRGAEGDDIVWVDSRQFLPLLVMPYGLTGSNSVMVAQHPYRNSNGDWGLAGNTGTLNLYATSTTGSNVYLLMLNDNDFSLYTLTGTSFANDVTGVADIISRIPDAPNQLDVPLSAIKVTTNKPILWDDIYDVRQFISSNGASSSALSGTQVFTDSTLSGNGTVANPLSVVNNDALLFNVADPIYGATGDGTTYEDSSINAAIDALNTAGNGILYFPPPTVNYRCAGALHTITANAVIRGDGTMSTLNGQFGSTIVCESATATLFTVAGLSTYFKDLSIINTAGSTPSAGAAIAVTHASIIPRCDFEHVFVKGFYINIDSQTNVYWSMRGCWLDGAVKYCLKIRDLLNVDAGDCSISDSVFSGHVYTGVDSAIRIESGGGIKITGCKFINLFTNGIDLSATGGISTAQLMIVNCSFEDMDNDAIHIASNGGHWESIIITSNQFNILGRYCVSVDAANLGELTNVIIDDNVFVGSSALSAISLTKVDYAYIAPNIVHGYASILTQSGCTHVTLAGGGGTVTNVSAGTGLTGGPITTTGTLSIANTTVIPGSYTNGNFTVNAQGQLTAASNGTAGGNGTHLIMATGIVNPPVPVMNAEGDDWVYSTD